jgi:hypothetical protein
MPGIFVHPSSLSSFLQSQSTVSQGTAESGVFLYLSLLQVTFHVQIIDKAWSALATKLELRSHWILLDDEKVLKCVELVFLFDPILFLLLSFLLLCVLLFCILLFSSPSASTTFIVLVGSMVN